MHRRKDFYGEDSDEFKPERWETLRPGWEYLPFNGGPRICIGRKDDIPLLNGLEILQILTGKQNNSRLRKLAIRRSD